MEENKIWLRELSNTSSDIAILKDLIRKARKQKKYLKWVWHTLESYDLRQCNKIISEEEKSLLLVGFGIECYIGLMGVYHFRDCKRCKKDIECSDEENADIWYFVLKEYSGQGYGKAAVQEFIDSSEGTYEKVGACVAIGNVPSMMLLDSIGFKCKCKDSKAACYEIEGQPVRGMRWIYDYTN